MGAGTVAMSLLVPANRKLRHVREHGAPGHVNVHVAGAFAAFFSGDEIYLPDVGNEIRMKNAPVVFGKVFSFFGKKLRVTGIEAVLEHVICIVDKLRIAVELEGDRLARERKVAAGLRAAGVEVLVPCVQRDCEGASTLPLKGAFGGSLIPDARRPATGGLGDNLFVELALGFCLFA